MKIALTAFIIFGFIGIAVFGVFAMGHGTGHSHDGCIAATANGQPCPEDNNPLRFLAFHLDAFKSFSTATFGYNLANALLLLLAPILTIGFGIFANTRTVRAIFAINYQRRQFLESHSFPYQRDLTHWLALHENSPATL